MPYTAIQGERLIIAATLDAVDEGQLFDRIPPHMTVVRWFSLPEAQRPYLYNAMDQLFTDQNVYQDLQGGEHLLYGEQNDIPVREMLNAQDGPTIALRALIKQIGKFPEGAPFVDVFSPHVSDEPERSVVTHEHIRIPTVALFSAHSDVKGKRVEKSYTLGAHTHG